MSDVSISIDHVVLHGEPGAPGDPRDRSGRIAEAVRAALGSSGLDASLREPIVREVAHRVTAALEEPR